MVRKKDARHRDGNTSRAKTSMRADTQIVAEKLERDWQTGCKWLAVAFVLTFGPMLLWAAYWW